jgi:hypothetical protein
MNAEIGARDRKPVNVTEAWVREPNVQECRPDSRWRVRLLKLQMTCKYEIEIGFDTRDDREQILSIDNARRSEFEWIRRELDSRFARLPHDKKRAIGFVQDLIRATPLQPIVACASPCFCRNATGFVMPHRLYGTAKGAFVWDAKNAPGRSFGEIRLIFDSWRSQAIDRARKSTLRRRRGTTLLSFGVDQASAIWRRVGGRATPRADSARLAAGRGAERSRKRLPSCSTSVSVSESRSASTSGQEARAPLPAARRSSSSFFKTRAKKLQATWPRIVSSSL